MANALRNLQLFRNGAPITNKTLDEVKEYILGAFTTGTLELNDGEPISIRYCEPESNVVKGLYGVAYVNGNTKDILWVDSNIDLVPQYDQEHPERTQYIHITEDENNVYTISANVVNVNAATGAADGLASAYDVQQYVNATIKDKFVKDGYVKHLGEDINHKMPEDPGYIETEDASGDPYLVLVLESGEIEQDPATDPDDDTKIYINVKDMITEYTAGDGIQIVNGVIGVDASRIAEIANGVAGDVVNTAIGNLGSVTATSGNYFTEIRVNAVTGQLEAEEAALPEGGGEYLEGHDINFRTETGVTGLYIDVALDEAIETSIAVGNLASGTTIPANASLGEILTMMLVKEYQATANIPTSAISVNCKNTYDVGEYLGELNVGHTYDVNGGSYSPESGYPASKWTQYNGSNPLPANCAEGTTTYYLDNTVITVTDGKYTYPNRLTEGTHTFKCQTTYGASPVTPKTNRNNDSTGTNVPITGGTTNASTKQFKVYYSFYTEMVTTLPADYADVFTDGTKNVLTSNTAYTSVNYDIEGGKKMILMVPTSRTFTIKNALGMDATSEFVSTGTTVTDANNVVYNVYVKANDASTTASYTALTFANA